MYLFGLGYKGLHKFNLVTMTWTQGVAPLFKGSHQSVVVVGDELYAIGGFDGADGILQWYNPTADAWTVGPSLPYGRAGSVQVGKLSRKRILACGGLVELERQNVRSCAIYSTIDQKWTSAANMLVAVNHAACGSWNDKVYIFGGRVNNNNAPEAGIDAVQIYNVKRNKWSYGNPMPFPRSGMGHAPYLAGHLWVVGGETQSRSVDVYKTNKNVYNQTYAYNVGTGKWHPEADMPIGIHGMWPVADTKRDRLIVAGGGYKQGRNHGGDTLFLQRW